MILAALGVLSDRQLGWPLALVVTGGGSRPTTTSSAFALASWPWSPSERPPPGVGAGDIRERGHARGIKLGLVRTFDLRARATRGYSTRMDDSTRSFWATWHDAYDDPRGI